MRTAWRLHDGLLEMQRPCLVVAPRIRCALIPAARQCVSFLMADGSNLKGYAPVRGAAAECEHGPRVQMAGPTTRQLVGISVLRQKQQQVQPSCVPCNALTRTCFWAPTALDSLAGQAQRVPTDCLPAYQLPFFLPAMHLVSCKTGATMSRGAVLGSRA